MDIAWRVEDKTPDPIPEGGWICLPFNVDGPSFRVGRIGGTIDPAKDIIFGANRDILCADRAITVRSGPGGAGVGVASADLPLWSLGRPGLWRYEPDYVPTDPEVFVNLYNNQWNTNYPLWIPGSWSASLRVYPVAEGASEEQAIFTPAWEIRQPCVAAFAVGGDFNTEAQRHREGRAGRPRPADATASVRQQGDGVALSRKGVRLTAFCPNPDGDGIVLRVWEQSGVGGEITVSLPSGMKATEAQPVNLRGERAGKPIPVKDGKFSFELNAWSPKSFIIKDTAAGCCMAVPGAQADSLKFLSLNIWGDYFDNPVGEREAAMEAAILKDAPDIVSLQEVTTNWWASPMFRNLEKAGYGIVRGDEEAALRRAAHSCACEVFSSATAYLLRMRSNSDKIYAFTLWRKFKKWQ